MISPRGPHPISFLLHLTVVEILSCDGLPNLDETPAGVPATGDKTDAFVAMLFEDTLVRTDVIFDRLNPRWMPWSMRAFAFPIQHPGSPLILAVFDYDQGPMNAHDPIGRVVINMTNFEAETVYNLSYKLHNSIMKDGRSRGLEDAPPD